jgi:hypothetical protein
MVCFFANVITSCELVIDEAKNVTEHDTTCEEPGKGNACEQDAKLLALMVIISSSCTVKCAYALQFVAKIPVSGHRKSLQQSQ